MKHNNKLKPLSWVVFSIVMTTLLLASHAWGTPSYFASVKSGFPVDVVGAANTSPNVTDLDGDGKKEIIIGTAAGYVYVINSSGAIVSQYSTGIPIESSPSVGDINNDGQLEIVVSTGGYACAWTCYAGVYAFDRNLNLLPGWPQRSTDHYGTGFNPGFVSTPALGDLDNDGDLEIVVGAFDERVHAWHHDGSVVANWPRWTYDTVSSSPAIVDIDNDGFREVIIGIEAHTWYPSWAPGQEQPDTPTLDGGYIYVLDRFAKNKTGFPQYINQIIQSAPAIGDINGDGSLDIVFGTGAYYPNVGFGIYAYDRYGNQLWKANTSSYVYSHPALGDLDGDGDLDVVIWCQDGNIYALDGRTGAALPGWPVQGRDGWGYTYNSQAISPSLADYDGDGVADVFLSLGWEVAIIKSNGTFITNNGGYNNDPNHPSYYTNGTTVPSVPAVGDMDGDNLLDIVVGSYSTDTGQGRIYAWETGKAVSSLPWPGFRKNASHTGIYAEVAQAVAASGSVSEFVTRFYEQCLSRSPDTAGLNGWVNDLQSGAISGANLAYSFVFSQEFIDRGTTNEEYLTILYTAFFNRSPDDAGYNLWLGLLNGGTSRLEVLNGFTGAQEFFNLCSSYGINPT